MDLMLFVSGEPGPALDPTRDVTSMSARLAGTVLPPVWLRSQPGTSGGPSWHIAREGMFAANLVLDIAHEEGRTVTLVNVNSPAEHSELVRRWVGTEELLPVLVRPDGARLSGLEEFTPGAVRRFVRRR